nr:MAG TPA: hypothetical protein [Caudoviricetes sp.]DAR93535.1 MAG TPA: hypothetical protein [Caudoviricetes sp.]
MHWRRVRRQSRRERNDRPQAANNRIKYQYFIV